MVPSWHEARVPDFALYRDKEFGLLIRNPSWHVAEVVSMDPFGKLREPDELLRTGSQFHIVFVPIVRQ